MASGIASTARATGRTNTPRAEKGGRDQRDRSLARWTHDQSPPRRGCVRPSCRLRTDRQVTGTIPCLRCLLSLPSTPNAYSATRRTTPTQFAMTCASAGPFAASHPRPIGRSHLRSTRSSTRPAAKSSARSTCSSTPGASPRATRKHCVTTCPSLPSAAQCSGCAFRDRP
jgi:hypothetical protein